MKRLAGRAAIVTGAGRGLGRSIARRFAAEGCAVAVLTRTAANAERTAAEIEDAGGRAMSVPFDVTDIDGIPGVVARVAEAFGRIDILVNNAMDTSSVFGKVLTVSRAQAEHQYLGGPLAMLAFMQACHPHLAERGGRIINMGSSAGVMGAAGLSAYAMAKEAVRALTRSAAREWGHQQITVNCICPVAATDSFDESMEIARQTGDLMDSVEMPLGRVGLPDTDIAPVALFLASDDAAYITGHTLMVDGGMMMDAAR